MIDKIFLDNTKEVIAPVVWKVSTIPQDKTLWWQNLKIKCEKWVLCTNHQSRYCEGQKEVINIDYNSQLQNILDEFDKFEVQCGNLVEKANECERKLVEMETVCHAIVVEENQQVMSVGLFLKSQPTGKKETIQLQRDSYSSIWWESSNYKGLTVGAWERLLLCAKFMEFLLIKWKTKDDVFFMS